MTESLNNNTLTYANITIHRPRDMKPISSFLKYYDNPNTLSTYYIAFIHFIRYITNISNPSLEIMDVAALKYLDSIQSNADLTRDIISFRNSLTETHAGASIYVIITIICSWMENNGFVFTKWERKLIFKQNILISPQRPEAELTRNMFKSIYHQFTAEWVRTLFLVMIATGMRIGEAMKLTEENINWNRKRTSIHIPAEITKNKNERTVYLTEEATESLRNYLDSKERKDGDSRVFPYNINTAEHQLARAVDKTKYGKTEEQKRQVHWHMTRKWFISRFSLYANKDIAEYIVGHDGYLTRSYHRFTQNQILTEYCKAEPYLCLFTPVPRERKENKKTGNQCESLIPYLINSKPEDSDS